MKEKKRIPNHWIYPVAVLIILLGLLLSGRMFKDSGFGRYPALIAEAYNQEQHHLSIPGSKEIKLTRTGAYGIYAEYPQGSSLMDYPEIARWVDCSLTSKSTGAKTEAVPDYIETNRYWSKNKEFMAILIMSITVNKPDTYTFACQYKDGRAQPDIVVALGPNYVWEFFRIVGKMGLSLFGGITVLCGSFFIVVCIIVVVMFKKQRSPLREP